MHTVSVPHGPDGSVLRWPFLCRSHTTSSHWTDGGRNGLGPFRHVDVLLSRPLDGHLRTQISAANFSFALSPNSPKYDDIRFPPRLLYYLCASRPSLHHSQTDRPQHRLPCSLKTSLTPFTDRPSSTPASLLSQESFFTPFTDCFVVNAGFLVASRVKNVFQPQDQSDQINLKILVKRTGIAVALPIKLKVQYNRHPHFFRGWRSYFELDR